MMAHGRVGVDPYCDDSVVESYRKPRRQSPSSTRSQRRMYPFEEAGGGTHGGDAASLLSNIIRRRQLPAVVAWTLRELMVCRC